MFGGLKQQSQIKNNLWQNHIVSFQYDATMRRCWVTAETNDGCFDAANANKSCIRVHGGQSSEFPIYPTTRERGISIKFLKVSRCNGLRVYAVCVCNKVRLPGTGQSAHVIGGSRFTRPASNSRRTLLN